ncbi:MAG TPA: hypothetical protein PKC30_15700 [Saprospiraceae bacterium]|nr:hypothetical protein [Saprospiraceae bacterium]
MAKYEELVKRYESSGLTRKAFAEQEGLGLSTLGYYLKKVRGRPSSGFTPIEITHTPEKSYIIISTAQCTEIKIPV